MKKCGTTRTARIDIYRKNLEFVPTLSQKHLVFYTPIILAFGLRYVHKRELRFFSYPTQCTIGSTCSDIK